MHLLEPGDNRLDDDLDGLEGLDYYDLDVSDLLAGPGELAKYLLVMMRTC